MDVARAFLSAGVTCLQLRAKTWASGPFLALSVEVESEAQKAGALLIINDRADVAAMAGARGLHVGQDDLRPVEVRQLVGAEAVVGLSTHTDAQLRAGLDEPITYLAIGPVFDTDSKATGYEPIGLDAVRLAARMTTPRRIPLVAIGGITLERAAAVIESGAAAVAVISDLLVGDPENRAREFLRALA